MRRKNIPGSLQKFFSFVHPRVLTKRLLLMKIFRIEDSSIFKIAPSKLFFFFLINN